MNRHSPAFIAPVFLSLTVAFFLLVAAPAALPAAETPAAAPLTLAECLALAGKRSEVLQAQSDRQKEAAQRLVQSRSGLLPDVAFRFAKYFRDNDNGIVAGEGLDTRLEAVQPLFYGFRKTEAVGFAKTAKIREDFLYRALARQVYGNVAQTFYAVAQIESDARNVRDTMQLLQDRVKELDQRIRLGKSRDSEVLMVESQMAALRAQGEQLEGARQKALETLSLLTGVPAASLVINDDLPPVAGAEPLDRALAAARTRSDIRAALQDVALQESQVRIARGALLPTANLDASWYASRGGSLSGSAWDVYLLMDVPLYRGGFLRSRIKEETFRLNEVRQQEQLLERQVDTEVRQLHHGLTASLAQVAAYREAYDKAERSYRSQLRDYRYGLVNNLDVLQAMTTLLSTKSSYHRSLIQVKLDKLLLDLATERIK